MVDHAANGIAGFDHTDPADEISDQDSLGLPDLRTDDVYGFRTGLQARISEPEARGGVHGQFAFHDTRSKQLTVNASTRSLSGQPLGIAHPESGSHTPVPETRSFISPLPPRRLSRHSANP
jgi:hypothetical protein